MTCHQALVVLALVAVATATGDAGASEVGANPVRKVVSLLQNMAKKVEKEGDAERALYDKFQCYCQTGAGDLETAISESTTKVPSLQSDIEEAVSSVAQMSLDLTKHQADRAAAKAAIAEATSLREKDNAEYQKSATELKGYVDGLGKAIPAIEKGMSGAALLQTSAGVAAAVRRAAVAAQAEITDDDRQTVLSFLSGSSTGAAGYIPGGGEILGVLKELKANYDKDLATVEKNEADSLKEFDSLVAAKTKQVKTLSASIENKTGRVGETKVQIVIMKGDLSDTEAALIADQKFLNDLSSDCSSKQKEMEERQKSRSEELVAIHETIKILNDDDALDLFKKTLPSASLLQLKAGEKQMQTRALALLSTWDQAPGIRFLELALMGKKVDFSKVIKMIDDMVALLKQEQVDDDSKVEYCNIQIDQAEDRLKELSGTQEDLETSIEERKNTIKTSKDEIKALQKGIKELDKLVAEATEQRKEENTAYTDLMSSDSAAKELLAFAKNRLNKFYSPKLYKAPAKRELTEEEQLFVNNGGELEPTAAPGGIAGTGVTAFVQVSAEPGKAPATWEGGYQKKGEESGGVVAMIDLLIRDLDKEMTEAKTEEDNAQKEYEGLMNDSASKRAKDLRSVEIKEASKANSEELLTKEDGELASTKKEYFAVGEYKQQLHGECDWILQNFDLRKEARAEESNNLKDAKAVLSGADFSLIQAAAPQERLLSRHRSA